MPSGGAVLHIRFTIEVTCGEEEPSRCVPRVEGEVFDFAGDEADETEVLVGRIGAYLVQTGRAFDEDFYTYAPELLHQESDGPVPSSSVSWANRIRRGRRRLG